MIEFKTAKALCDGDAIGLFSPSEWLGDSRPEHVRDGAEFLERQGFKVQYARNFQAQDTIRAGTPGQRLADINELLDRTDVHALLATWGGKACNHLVPNLPYEKLETMRKPVIGFSDTCVLSNAITAQTGLVTFYGPNIAGKLNESSWSDLAWLKRSFDWQTANILKGSHDVGALTLRSGTATGRLVGGNLNCFVLGVVLSKLDLGFFDGGIFFWEDVGLTPRQIDQFLTGLINVGFMDRINGMIIGDFFHAENNEWLRSDPLESVMHAIRDYKFPVVYAPSFGHRKLENPVFPIGARSMLDADRISLTVLDPVVG